MIGGRLFCGDKLDVLQRYIEEESVDLVYLDPPFNPSRDYNLLFSEQDGSRAAAQVKAFKDTWDWDQSAITVYREGVESGGDIHPAYSREAARREGVRRLDADAPRPCELEIEIAYQNLIRRERR